MSERFNSSCKTCHGERTAARKQKDEYKAQQREYRGRTREQRREQQRRYIKTVPQEVRLGYMMKSKYGITFQQYEEMAETQGGVCKVCGMPPERMGVKARLHIDHDHMTGKIRGLLCHHCNVALGLVRENEDVLLAMVSYLREHRG